MPVTGRELRSTLDADGTLELALEGVVLEDPGTDEVIVRVEAAPINPSDLLLMAGPADRQTARKGGSPDRPTLSLDVPKEAMAGLRGRLGQSLPTGNEGAGLVIAAGANAKALEGKRVAIFGGGMFADYRQATARDVVPLPEGASSAEGAAIFVNPLTALGIVETARKQGHQAMVHTAAASNVGRMVQKICNEDGFPVVNIVRSQEQVDILRSLGAGHVLNSKDADFRAQLLEAISETGATVAFDPIGGGTLGSVIVEAMEQAAVRRMTEFSRYGSRAYKQLYLYGGLDPSPTVLNRMAFGTGWSVSSWFLTDFLASAGPDGVAPLIGRVLAKLTTTFATHYSGAISLAEALDPQVFHKYARVSTSEKYLIDPTRG